MTAANTIKRCSYLQKKKKCKPRARQHIKKARRLLLLNKGLLIKALVFIRINMWI